MRLLVDTNVVIDYAAMRSPFFEQAELLFMLGYAREFELWLSASQMTDAFYLLSSGGKPSHVDAARRALNEIRRSARICSITEADVDAALASGWDDFEDACVYQAARRVRAEAIITRNARDYRQSNIKVFDCAGLFAFIEREQGVSYAQMNLDA